MSGVMIALLMLVCASLIGVKTMCSKRSSVEASAWVEYQKVEAPAWKECVQAISELEQAKKAQEGRGQE